MNHDDIAATIPTSVATRHRSWRRPITLAGRMLMAAGFVCSVAAAKPIHAAPKALVVAPAIMNGADFTSFGMDAFGQKSSDSALKTLAADHVNWVSITTSVAVNRSTDTVMASIPNDIQFTGPNANMAHAIATAKSLGMAVSLKLQTVDLVNGDVLQGYSYVPKNSKQFFASYQTVLLAYATFAQTNGVSLMVIGTELGGLITGATNQNSFTDMIANVRKSFTGKLTYASVAGELPAAYYTPAGANCAWCEEYDELHYVSFWSALDYIGIDAYPNLSAAVAPTVPTLSGAMTAAPDLVWGTSAIFNQIGYWASEAARFQKPVILTETGAESMAYAALCTGCGPATGTKVNQAIQANTLTAMLGAYQTNAKSLDLAGIFLWNTNAYSMADAGDSTLGYGFIGKTAESAVSSFYAAY